MDKTVQIIVSGRVQGVGFRWATKQVADHMNVTGSVTNLMDGHVKIIAQADPDRLKRFIASIKASPTPYGHVSHIDISSIKSNPYNNFSVR